MPTRKRNETSFNWGKVALPQYAPLRLGQIARALDRGEIAPAVMAAIRDEQDVLSSWLETADRSHLTEGMICENMEYEPPMAREQAFVFLSQVRWPRTGGNPVCPLCGSAFCYWHHTRNLFSCASCHHQFTLTSGTMLGASKLPLPDIVRAIALLVEHQDRGCASALMRKLKVNYRTGLDLTDKFRKRVPDGLPREVKWALATGFVSPPHPA